MTSTEGPEVASNVLPLQLRPRVKLGGVRFNALQGALHAALERERILIEEKHEMSRRQSVLTQEFEHRLVNGLQMVTSLLILQSRATSSSDVAEQLALAATRVSALGRVHRQLHQLDHCADVEFKNFVSGLCQDLSGLLLDRNSDRKIVVEGTQATMATELAIPLGFVLNELITNAVKYGKGDIVVRLTAQSPVLRSVSVVDQGHGLPPGFDPADSKGLGMRIVKSLAKQIGGELQVCSDPNGHRSFLAVSF
jgi:two-component system, sensor histidine kinase PdtaS